ncbi:hypothetical protein ETI10_00295 [Macrococcoides goetzii]|nr:hypothetical protein [Macrococcus goetzii]TDM41560.1 hypothetical protein ETI10_00295 [Macrococcus goetzii]
MKKLLVSSVAASLLVSGLVSVNEAEAAKANIDYSNPSVAKKAKAGKLSMDGFIIGEKVAKYYNNKRYYNEDGRLFWLQANNVWYYESNYDAAFADFQSSKKIGLKNKKITRIVDKNIDNKRIVPRTKMLKVYGKPLRTQTTIASYKNDDSKIVDVYKNITFFYTYKIGYNEAPKLESAVIFHNKNNADLEKWYYYAANDAGSDGNMMNEYITSSEWASY